MNTLLELAAPILRSQQVLITRQQCFELCRSDAPLRQLLDRGIWEPVDRAIFGPVGVPMTWRRRVMAAYLLAPAGSLVSHRASASLLCVGGLDEPMPEVSIPAGSSFRRPWVITHESGDLELADVVVIDGIPATGPCRLAMDLGSVVSFPRFKHTVRELRHGHGVSSEELLRTYLRHKRQGRNGGGALRDWLDRYLSISGNAETGLELVVLDAILDAQLPAPVLQHWVTTRGGRFRLDLAYPHLMLAIEVDGAQHDDLDIVPLDGRRTKLLNELGWRVIRVRSKHLATDLAKALRELRLALESPVDR